MRVPRVMLIAVLGAALGAALSAIGFSDFGEVHRLFTLQDQRLLWVFLTAVGLTAAGYQLLRPLRQGRKMPHRSFHPGLVPGGVVFGVGWALTGACPSVALVQLGEGKLAAAFTAAGILLGVRLAAVVNARLGWDGCPAPVRAVSEKTRAA